MHTVYGGVVKAGEGILELPAGAKSRSIRGASRYRSLSKHVRSAMPIGQKIDVPWIIHIDESYNVMISITTHELISDSVVLVCSKRDD